MMLRFIFSCILLSVISVSGRASTTGNDDFAASFNTGIQHYQAKEWPAANVAFRRALDIQPNNAATLTDFALTLFQQGMKGASIAVLRKALVVDPQNATAQSALKFEQSQLDIKEIPHELQLSEMLHQQLFQLHSLASLLLLSALIFFAAGWTITKDLVARKKARVNQTVPPPTPVFPILFSVLWLASLALVLGQWLDSRVPRGTVIANKLSVLSAPDASASSLFDLYAGLEVLVEDHSANWLQITYPGGLTGWAPKEQIFTVEQSVSELKAGTEAPAAATAAATGAGPATATTTTDNAGGGAH